MEERHVLLLNEDRSLSLDVWFLGFSQDAVREFVVREYASSKRWTQFKFVS